VFTVIREQTTRRLLELSIWVQRMKHNGRNLDASSAFTDAMLNEKGLFFVFAYGIIEATVTSVVLTTITELNSLNITVNECNHSLYSLAFSREYDSLSNVGRDRKWERRWDISQRYAENALVIIPNDVMPTDGKNIRFKQLQSIAKSFGLKTDILPEGETGGYLNSITNNRNCIAHGDKLPSEVGKEYSLNDIQKYVEVTEKICNYLIDSYENYIISKSYLK